MQGSRGLPCRRLHSPASKRPQLRRTHLTATTDTLSSWRSEMKATSRVCGARHKWEAGWACSAGQQSDGRGRPPRWLHAEGCLPLYPVRRGLQAPTPHKLRCLASTRLEAPAHRVAQRHLAEVRHSQNWQQADHLHRALKALALKSGAGGPPAQHWGAGQGRRGALQFKCSAATTGRQQHGELQARHAW